MATVDDIAKRAGVSPSSVSRVLNGRGYASEAMRRRVIGAAQDLGYTPNRVAQSLRLKQTRILGLIIADVENAFYSQIAKGVEAVAKEAGYYVVLCNTSDDPREEDHYLGLLASLQVDGLVITPTARNGSRLKGLLSGGMRIVQVDRRVAGLKSDAVLVDNVGGAYELVRHLLAHGHSRIGVLAGSTEVTTGHDRLEGYKRALREANLEVDAALVMAGSFRREAAKEAVQCLLGVSPRPTAILAANNVLAEVCLQTLSEFQLRVPEDISLVAFDDPLWMRLVNPPLTAMAQPTTQMAQVASDLLLRRLREATPTEPVTIVLEPKLRLGASVATLGSRDHG